MEVSRKKSVEGVKKGLCDRECECVWEGGKVGVKKD